MPSLTKLTIVGIPVALVVTQFLQPKVELLGLSRTPVNLNNGHCQVIPGLEACEDAWIHEASGLAYLPCSNRESRLNWVPAMLHLNASALPTYSTDAVHIYDFATNSHRKLSITNLPAASQGIYVHAIDVWVDSVDSKKLTVFLNSHRPPLEREKSAEVGASSVIEIFETTLGSDTMNWVQTVEHELIRTPNNLVVTGPRSFYVSNDHRRKVHWARAVEFLHAEKSDIVYCDASGAQATCIVAADGLIYPNGIAKGPNSLLYSASSLVGNIRVWEAQEDHTLNLVEEVHLPRPTDNIHVSPNGEVYAACFSRVLDLVASSTRDGQEMGVVSPTEVWRMSNHSGVEEDRGSKFAMSLAFADDGKIMSGATTAAPYKNKLLLTGGGDLHIALSEEGEPWVALGD
ncbi:arylesterase / paraoxonase, partial [Phenoliferia sp. Uapishka_3]